RLKEIEHPLNLPRKNASAHEKPRHVAPEQVASIETAIAGLQLRLRSNPTLHSGPPVPCVDDGDDDEREPEVLENDFDAHFSIMPHGLRGDANLCLVTVTFSPELELSYVAGMT